MFCSPLYSSTRLNGMPIQMLAIVTETNDQGVEVSQWTLLPPNARSSELTTPDSLLSIQAQTDAETIRGSSHGTSSSARSVPESRKCCVKKSARARPMPYWNSNDMPVKNSVCQTASENTGSWTTVE